MTDIQELSGEPAKKTTPGVQDPGTQVSPQGPPQPVSPQPEAQRPETQAEPGVGVRPDAKPDVKTEDQSKPEAQRPPGPQKQSEPQTQTQSTRAINLLPQLTKREMDIVEKKMNFSLSGAVFFILMAGAAVGILGVNLLFKRQVATVNVELASTEETIRSHSTTELQARTLSFKLNTYKSIRGSLFKNDQVLGELERLAPEGIEIEAYGMTTDPGILGSDSEMEFFQVSGTADSVKSISDYAYALESDSDQYEQVIISLVQKKTEEELEEEQTVASQTVIIGLGEELPVEYNFTISLLAKNLTTTKESGET